jgi:hypothetical protein
MLIFPKISDMPMHCSGSDPNDWGWAGRVDKSTTVVEESLQMKKTKKNDQLCNLRQNRSSEPLTLEFASKEHTY